MTDIVLLGAGGQCRAAIDFIEAEGCFTIAGIVERPGAEWSDVSGYRVIGTDDDLLAPMKRWPAARVTIGQIKTPEPRIRVLVAACSTGAYPPVETPPRAYVARTASIKPRTLVMHDATVIAGAQIGDHCHGATGARVKGDATIADRCFIGSGAIAVNGTTTGEGSVAGAGCENLDNLAAGSFVAETPKRTSP